MLALLAALPILGSALASPVASNSLLITPHGPAALADCLRGAYYGAYGGLAAEHIYVPTDACVLGAGSLRGIDTGRIVPLDEAAGRLVWVGRAGVEDETAGVDAHWLDIASTAARAGVIDRAGQQTTFAAPPPITLVHSSADSLILRVPPQLLGALDTFLPAHLVPVVLPSSPLRVDPKTTAKYGVPEHLAANLANLTAGLRFRPAVDRAVNAIEHDEIRRNVRWLTGEAPSGIVSRHSFTEGALVAADWIKGKVEATGAKCHLHPFLAGFAPNVICTYPSARNLTDRVILSGHYDSRGSFGSTRAPGADDDASGSGHVLAIAEAIGRLGVRFEHEVTLAFFAGEEQGLLGSHAYAEHLSSINATVLLHIQADMLAYRVPGEPLQLGLPSSIELPEASALLAALAKLYAPALVVGRTDACCSDHQSFLAFSFPATSVSERNGPIADPMYHNSGDLSNRANYDFEQIREIAKVTFAALLEVAGDVA
ncbi:hypothetical protein Q5752_003607 [Cryptotrichosporon argae]